MKKIFFLSLGLIGTSLFAQDTSIPDISGPLASSSSGNIWMSILGFLFYGFLYIGVPVLFYCLSSYSLSTLSKHYYKKTSSKISWVPFVRYYDFVKHATKSGKKAFIVTLLPWILTVGSFLLLIILGMMESRVSPGLANIVFTSMNVMAIVTLVSAISIIAMSIWRAFIISRCVRGDTTTALGLSTYTALVLWYIALDRVNKKTDIIGILGFVLLGLIVCFYVTIFLVFGLSGVESFLGA